MVDAIHAGLLNSFHNCSAFVWRLGCVFKLPMISCYPDHLGAVSMLASCCCHISSYCPSGLCMQILSTAGSCCQAEPVRSGDCISQTVLNMSSNLCTVHHPRIWILIEPSEYRKAFRQIQPLRWCRRLSRGLEGMIVPRHRGPAQLPPAVGWTGTGSRLRTRLLCIRSFHPALPLTPFHPALPLPLLSPCPPRTLFYPALPLPPFTLKSLFSIF